MSDIDANEDTFDRGEWVQAANADDNSTVCASYAKHNNKRNRGNKFVVRLNRDRGSVRVSYFETINTHGRLIRNALNGQYAKHVVGSSDEYLYFSVLMATGESGQTPDCLFYDSPEQYERHMHIAVNDSVKDLWRNRYNSMLKAQQDRLSSRLGASVEVK